MSSCVIKFCFDRTFGKIHLNKSLASESIKSLAAFLSEAVTLVC